MSRRSVVLVLLALAGIQALILVGCGAVANLSCERPSNACVLTTGPIWAKTTQRFALSDVVRARVDERRSTDSEGTEMISREVVVGLKAGAFPFGMYESLAWQKALPTVNRINNFLDTPSQSTLVAKQDSRPKIFLFSSVFIWSMPLILFLVWLLPNKK